MSAELLDRIRRLEESNRRWKAVALGLAVLMVPSLAVAAASVPWPCGVSKPGGEVAVMERDLGASSPAEQEARRAAGCAERAEQAQNKGP